MGASSAGPAPAPVSFLVCREIGRPYHFLVLHALASQNRRSQMNLTEKSNWPSAWQRLLLAGLAGDSSGFTPCRFTRWFDHKYGTVIEGLPHESGGFVHLEAVPSERQNVC
jgi:hypothetical protein